MNADRSQQLIVGSLAATAVITTSSKLASGDVPGIPLVIGLAGAGFGLSVGAMFAPDLAASFAVLILVASAFVFSGPLWDAVGGLTGAPAPAPAHPRKAHQ